jgi:hypothetical protein
MRASFAAIFALAFVSVASAAQTLGVQLVATLPSAAPTVTVSPTTGAETSGPVFAWFYYTPATVTSGVASCPTFSTTTWTLANATGVAVTSSAANAATYTQQGFTPGTIQCFAATNSFQAGGPPSAAAVLAPLVVIILGSPATPTSAGASVVL